MPKSRLRVRADVGVRAPAPDRYGSADRALARVLVEDCERRGDWSESRPRPLGGAVI